MRGGGVRALSAVARGVTGASSSPGARSRWPVTRSTTANPGAYLSSTRTPQASGCGSASSSARALYSTQRETKSETPPSFAFAFDIDGVLLHVAKPIPGAAKTLRYLQDHNIPFILLTNGGGKLEAERVKDLSSKLGVHLTTENFVQSHTPFRQLVEGGDGEENSLRDKTILVTGADAAKCRDIAESYGFKNVITPADILFAHPSVFPFDPLLESVYASTHRALPKPIYAPGGGRSLTNSLKIDAMFVFNDPRDWALDIQVIADLLLSHAGYLGTYSSKNADPSLPACGWQQDGQPPLYFSNADLFWSTGFHLPRFGQGAFQAAVAGVWRRITGGHELQRRAIGKPYGETYRFAELVLGAHRHEILRTQGYHEPPGTLRSVYMVGDNPESDIAGANEYASEVGTEWCSVLVRTGVWSPERGGQEVLKGRLEPKVVVDDVEAAVRWALEREGWKM
ncbi:HAD-superfamily hydrolase [Apodospora peruviana]|uniref:HAD-superfamily hydrolase n=1 Tax=Apodospora peruviana TaxID=516989 RepID=A0AAE0ISK4_9PEZI|nr:HAD-superfamily hydrolase [Apodospora peruviana]